MPDSKFILCPKCGAESTINHLRSRNSYDCEQCGEPIRALIELDTFNWSSGDFFPAKEEVD